MRTLAKSSPVNRIDWEERTSLRVESPVQKAKEIDHRRGGEARTIGVTSVTEKLGETLEWKSGQDS